jgi:hypothetical protein
MTRSTSAKITTTEGWLWFGEIMRALQFDGGTIQGVDALMMVAEQIGQQSTRTADHLQRELDYSRNLLFAVPTREEAETIWYMHVGPGTTMPDPDPVWVEHWIRSRTTTPEEAPDVSL